MSAFRSAYPPGRHDDSVFPCWRRAKQWTQLLPCVVAVLLAGCGDPTGGRQAISGTITLKGELLDEGVIEFFPQGDSVSQGGGVCRRSFLGSRDRSPAGWLPVGGYSGEQSGDL